MAAVTLNNNNKSDAENMEKSDLRTGRPVMSSQAKQLIGESSYLVRRIHNFVLLRCLLWTDWNTETDGSGRLHNGHDTRRTL